MAWGYPSSLEQLREFFFATPHICPACRDVFASYINADYEATLEMEPYNDRQD